MISTNQSCKHIKYVARQLRRQVCMHDKGNYILNDLVHFVGLHPDIYIKGFLVFFNCCNSVFVVMSRPLSTLSVLRYICRVNLLQVNW